MNFILGFAKSLLDFGTGLLAKITQRETLKNSPAVQAGAVKADEQKRVDQIAKNAASGNLDAVRKDDAL